MGLRNSTQEMALPLRDKLRKSAGLYLEPEEQIQAVFLAKRPEMQYNDRAVVATDQRILLLELGMRVSTVKSILAEVPRETKLGPCRGVLYPIGVFGIDLQVFRRFFRGNWSGPFERGITLPVLG